MHRLIYITEFIHDYVFNYPPYAHQYYLYPTFTLHLLFYLTFLPSFIYFPFLFYLIMEYYNVRKIKKLYWYLQF